jgi:hypothetical protein
MPQETVPSIDPAPLLRAHDHFITHQALCAVANLGVADFIGDGPRSTLEIAHEFKVNEGALYRTLRLLASQGIFEETTLRRFRNTDLSSFLRTGVPGSVRPLFIFWGSAYTYRCYGELLYCIQTGKPSWSKLSGMDDFEYLRHNPELARVFDDAMTSISDLAGPAIAAAYNFGEFGSLMDVGGGSGILLSHILRAHRALRGVLADQAHVLARAQDRGVLSGEFEARTTMTECDFFKEIPKGCRAYLMKSVIHDWNDDQARTILVNCRKSIPKDGVLLLVEFALPDLNLPSLGKYLDLIMLISTEGRERTVDEFRELLGTANFRLDRVVPTAAGVAIIEARPI